MSAIIAGRRDAIAALKVKLTMVCIIADGGDNGCSIVSDGPFHKYRLSAYSHDAQANYFTMRDKLTALATPAGLNTGGDNASLMAALPRNELKCFASSQNDIDG